MGARRFAPDSGQFLQEDVYNDALGDLGLSTDPLTQNRYALAAGNPVSFIESDGHDPHAIDTNANNGCFDCGGSKAGAKATSVQGAAGAGKPEPQTDVSSSSQRKAGPDPLVDAKDDRGYLRAEKALTPTGQDASIFPNHGVEGKQCKSQEACQRGFNAFLTIAAFAFVEAGAEVAAARGLGWLGGRLAGGSRGAGGAAADTGPKSGRSFTSADRHVGEAATRH